jgi:hypothetical protein
MPWFEIDLEDGKKPVGFSLNAADSARFVNFMAECQHYKEDARAANAEVKRLERLLQGNAGVDSPVAETDRFGWCKHCATGNDQRGYAHQDDCARPRGVAPSAESSPTPGAIEVAYARWADRDDHDMESSKAFKAGVAFAVALGVDATVQLRCSHCLLGPCVGSNFAPPEAHCRATDGVLVSGKTVDGGSNS